MKISICLSISLLICVLLSDYIKKYKTSFYVVCSSISITLMYYTLLILNGYNVEFMPVIKEIMNSIDSGALGGALFILVMYMGVIDKKNIISKKLVRNRGEISIIAGIFTIPHNFHYFTRFILQFDNISRSTGISLWTNLMMFASGVFGIIILIPLFVTSFMYIRKKMSAKKWKILQEYAYIFYAMIYVQVMMVYLARPSGWNRNLNLVLYTLIFGLYTVFKVKLIYEKKKNSSKVSTTNQIKSNIVKG